MNSPFTRTTRFLLWTETVLHIIVFIMLVLAVILIVIDTVRNFTINDSALLILINNALLLLIIKEIIWSVLRFLKQEKFSLSPFIYIGVISSVREILFLGIKNSIESTDGITLSLQILVNAFVVFMLVISYYLFKKARIIAGEDS